MTNKKADNSTVAGILINNEKSFQEQYYNSNENSLIFLFNKELRDLGLEFETSSQTLGFMPKHKEKILPLALKYYQMAKHKDKTNEQNHFLSFFAFNGLNSIVPFLIKEFKDEKTLDITRWFISDCLYKIRSKEYTRDYLSIVSDKAFGMNRQMIILLLGKLKEESTVPILIDLLEDEEVRLHVICALGEFKKEEFRCHFERFEKSNNPGWSKYSKKALKKLH
jgi:hypothetical protein